MGLGREHRLVECFHVVEGWRGYDERTRQGVEKVRANIYFAEFLGASRLIRPQDQTPGAMWEWNSWKV
jgi:hypothetical protein